MTQTLLLNEFADFPFGEEKMTTRTVFVFTVGNFLLPLFVAQIGLTALNAVVLTPSKIFRGKEVFCSNAASLR